MYGESLALFPHRGIRRDDLMPDLRVTNHAGSAVITFEVDTHAKKISVVGIYYGGQNYEAGEGRNG